MSIFSKPKAPAAPVVDPEAAVNSKEEDVKKARKSAEQQLAQQNEYRNQFRTKPMTGLKI